MRQAVIELLRCPLCHAGRLSAQTDGPELVFGPLRCRQCDAHFPVAEGIADLTGSGPPSPQALQWGFDHPAVARSYERYVRPALQLTLARRRVDRDSELLLYRALLGAGAGALLDLGCGTGLFARRLTRPWGGPVIGLDVSRPMLEEAAAQAREAGVMVDFVRARAPTLPFQDGSLAAVLHADALHYLEEPRPLLEEIARVLAPGGRYVASTYLPPRRLGRWVHARAGLYPRSEAALKEALTRAGFTGFERMMLEPFIVLRADRAA